MAKRRNDNQDRIMDFIRSEIKTKGYPPTVREIGDAVGLKSTSTVHGHLMRLEKKGLIYRHSMTSRTMELLDDEPNDNDSAPSLPVPLVGRVTAGVPILAEENIEEYIPIPKDALGEGVFFILSVKGESMIGAGILDGDCIVVRQQPDAVNGDIVVAMIDDEATVKRFYKENGMFRLQPENDTMLPILTQEVTILGKVVYLYRRFG